MVPSAEVDDLLQETMIRIATGWDGLQDIESKHSWMFRIASNVCADYYRKAYRSKQFPEFTSEFKLIHDDIPSDPGHELESKELGQCVQDVIDTLPKQYSTILIDADMLGLSGREMAKRHGLSVGAVKTRLSRARRRLKEILEAECDVNVDSRSGVSCEPKSECSICGPASRGHQS
jgi:RNA polymerase sigma-70 factor (ECF subfamily)